jgi:integrase
MITRVLHGPPTVQKLLDEYVTAHEGVSTRKVYRSLAKKWLTAEWLDKPIDAFTALGMIKWIAWQKEHGASPSLTKYNYALMRAAVRWGVSVRLLTRVPWGEWQYKVKIQTREREAARSVDELLHILHAAKAYDDAKNIQASPEWAEYRSRRWTGGDGAYVAWSYMMTAIAVSAILGLRNGELAGLGWDDFKVAGDGTWRVRLRYQALSGWRTRHPEWTRPQDPIKNRKQTTMIVPPALVALLELHREESKRRDRYARNGPVFPAAQGPHLWRSGRALASDEVRAITKAAGLGDEGWVAHSFRHTFCTLESFATNDLRALQERTRHASLSSLLRYLHASSRSRETKTGVQLPLDLLPPHDTIRAPALHDTIPAPPPSSARSA